MSTTPPIPLDLANDAVCHGLVVEASAGTGKTYSVAALVTREIALRDDLRIGQILITTFTRNAAAELRDRVRRRLADTAALLRSGDDAAGDVIVERLREGSDDEIAARIARLERALAEFDTATISTIHGVCSRVLRMAGIEVSSVVDTAATEKITAEVVNDVVVSRATPEHRWDEKRIIPLVEAMLADPFVEPWIDPEASALSQSDRSRLEALSGVLRECVARVQAATAAQPSFNDLLRIAHDLIHDESRVDLLLALMQRFQLAIVDEAQDTDRLQWAFFRRLFPGGDGRALVSVGDPKQAIYGFRGADVRAYVAYARDAKARRTLTTNRRSDQPLLDALNAGFDGQTFGEEISYLEVNAPSSRQKAQISGVSCVEFVDLGDVGNQQALTRPVLGKVIELLEDARLPKAGSRSKKGRPLEPRDICVLVRSGGAGRRIQQELAGAGIPAVTGGTSSVMASEMASDVRSLLDAIEQPSATGRVRRAAATVFFGHSLLDVGSLTDEALGEVQDGLYKLVSILTTKGIAALAATLEADVAVMKRIAAGRQGERNITDFLHLFEAMDSAGPRRGCTPSQALQIFSRLAVMDDNHELVSRRVESDADAVKILTIHAAKGLQFPCVIVADLWKTGGRGGGQRPIVFEDDGTRKLDLSFALERESARAKAARQAADHEEGQRLIYVAVTRAEHALTLLVARSSSENEASGGSLLQQTVRVPSGLQLIPPHDRTVLTRSLATSGDDAASLVIAPAPPVLRTFRRVSFSSLTAVHGRGGANPYAVEGAGYDEPSREAEPPLAAAADLATPPLSHELIDLPAGLATGSVLHAIFEQVSPQQEPLEDEVRRVVDEQPLSRSLKPFRESLIRIVCSALQTPLGAPLGDLTLAEIPATSRLPEMEFSMGLASLDAGIKARAIGQLLETMLSDDDPLRPYATTLASPAFDIPVGGLLTGSIDAVLQLPESTPESPRLLLVDYKSNSLHRTGMADPLSAYDPSRLPAAMADHHYPLQALLYGTAVFRLLRWRLPEADPDRVITGVLYAFVRGMLGSDTPADSEGRRSGVFFWKPPAGLWQQLSDLLSPAPLAGGRR